MTRDTPTDRFTGKTTQAVKKEAKLPRRSARLQRCRMLQLNQDLHVAHKKKCPDTQLQTSTTPQPVDQKRKRSCNKDTPDQPIQKRQRLSPMVVEGAQDELVSDSINYSNPIDYWRRYQRWPRSYLESENIIDIDIMDTMNNILARKKSALVSIKEDSNKLCLDLLKSEKTIPGVSFFSDDVFEDFCDLIQTKNETRIIVDVKPLIVPSAGSLTLRNSKHLKILVESMNASWSNSIPFLLPRPQPDYSVGFRQEAFTADQRKRLEPFIGDLNDLSFFVATWYMYFPFLSCEVEGGVGGVDVAERQNAHSMAVAVRDTVELFRLVKLEKELDCEVLAFSVSHNHEDVRIYGHYPVIKGKDTEYYRHMIQIYHIRALDGKDR